MRVTAKELAILLNGVVEGNPEASVDRPSKIEEGGPGTISFLGNEKYEPYAYTSNASILLVHTDWQPKQPVTPTLLRVDDVYAAIAKLFQQFGEAQQSNTAVIAKEASIDESSQIGSGTSIGRFTIVEKGAAIGEQCQISDQVYIGPDVKIGNQTKIYPGVKILKGCEVGSNCIIHSNTVIGSDGFGFAPQQDGTYEKIQQLGNVLIEDNVEIGANTTIDRATLGSTVIKKGVKLDNLIQIGHNVVIDENTVIAAQVGIAGSTKIGKSCQIGGQAGFVGHIKVADGTKIQAQSGIASHVKQENQALFGSPAFHFMDYIRSYAVFKKLPELYRRVNTLEHKQKGISK